VQIADELARAGRDVVLSVGAHSRVPRTYRGADIMAWLDRVGVLGERADPTRDLGAARAQPSFQLIGSTERRAIDLGTLRAAGVRLVGRFTALEGDHARFADDLASSIGAAQSKLDRLLDRIDAFCRGGEPEASEADRPPPIAVDRAPTVIDLRARRIGTIVWATGSRPAFPRIDLPVFDHSGALVHCGGATEIPGLYFLGLKLQRRRSSTFLHGVGQDAQEIADELADAFSCAPRAA
jgi:putative flavoprotein involved in K+ transport